MDQAHRFNRPATRTFRHLLSASFLLLISAAAANAQSIQLAWNANTESNISGYILYYGTVPGSYPNSINVGNVTTRTVSGLMGGLRYYFALKALNTSGLQSGFSAEVNAVAPATPTAAPATPSSPSPSNNSTGLGTGTSLVWSATGAISYTVKLGTANPPGQVATGVNSASYKPTSLSPNTKYYWQIVATNSAGSTTGSVWSFTTGSGGSVPSTPSSPSPQNNKGGLKSVTSLTWSGSGATSYSVRFGPTSPPPDVASVTNASYGVSNLQDDKRYYWQVVAHNNAGSTAGPIWSFKLGSTLTMTSDFDGDGQSDYTVFRPSTGSWFNLRSSSNFTTSTDTKWGVANDVPVPGDYDGNGTTDLAVFRPATGDWYIKYVGASGTIMVHWGMGSDIPVPSDYDGDGVTDIAVYRPSTGEWYIRRSSGSPVTLKWGMPGDIPLAGDYDGDDASDLAIFRPANGDWFILKSTTNYLGYTHLNWGMSGDTPVTGDWDRDGRADIAVYRSATGEWFIKHSSTVSGYGVAKWGDEGDIPVSADFDGDGFTDIAVYRPAAGIWYALTSSSNFTSYVWTYWGAPGDIPISQ